MSVQPVALVHGRQSVWPEISRSLPVVALRYAAIGILAGGLAALHLRHRPATLCPFRALTGIPCPFCGGTTAALDLGHANLRGAISASPFAVGLLTLGPLLKATPTPQWWRVSRNRWIVITTVVLVSELWELVRFGIISL